MRLRDMTPAQRELARRKLAQAPGARSTVPLELDDDSMGRKLGVKAGFRAGKRRKGNSLLKVKPREVTRATIYDVRDEHGERIASITTLRYTREAK